MSQTKPPRGGGMGHGPGGGMGAVQKPKDFKKTFKTLVSYFKPYKIGMLFVVIFAVASTIFTIVGPKILGKATTSLFDSFKQAYMTQSAIQVDFDFILKIVITLIILYVISAFFGYLQGYIVSGVVQKLSFKLREEISVKINKIPLKYYDSVTHGEILSRITNDIDTVSMSLQQSMTQIITSVTTIIGILIMMLSINVSMTVVALISLPITLVFVMAVVKGSQKYFKGQQKSLGQINGQIEEVYSGHNIIKAFNMEDECIKDFKEINKDLYHSAWKANFLSGLMMPITMFIGNLGYVAICLLGGYLAINGKLDVGNIQSFIQYIRQFNQPIMQTANIANVLQSTMAAAERVFEFLNVAEEVPETENPIKIENIEGHVKFDNITFGYVPEKTIIKNVSVEVKPGQKVAIVGPTGAGKTTIINLLLRFYDVNSGAIKIDGIDIRDMTREDLRSIFGMVLQDTWLFSGTIRDNLAYGKIDATDEEIISAAKSAHAHKFIKQNPNGYQMEINEDATNISQGQKQLLTITRAILADPPILILDEATSSVDTRTEILIQKAMNSLMEGRTSFIIAHRLSTIRDADLILVMKDGNIIEQGNHEQLLSENGFYAELYNSQFAK